MDQVRAHRSGLADVAEYGGENKAKDRRKRIDLSGEERRSKASGSRPKSMGDLLSIDEEVGDIVRIGRCGPGASRSSIASTSEAVSTPVHRET